MLLPLGFVVLAGCADTEPATQTVSAPVLAGVRSTNAGVVEVFNPDESCTGWLIAPNLVVTARHCVSHVSSGSSCSLDADAGFAYASPSGDYDVGQLGVVKAQSAVSPLGALHVAEVIVPADSAGQPLCGHDIALIRLAQPIADAVIVPPRIDAPPVVGEAITVVGYGQTGGGTNAPETAGTRREITNAHVESVGLSGQATAGDPHVRTTDREWMIDTGPCFGDSGSPAIASDGRSVGVMSRGAGAVCADMVYERVDVFADWLRASTIAATATAGIEAPAWVGAAQPDAGTPDDAIDPTDGATASPHTVMTCAVEARTPARGAAGFLALGLALGTGRRRRTR